MAEFESKGFIDALSFGSFSLFRLFLDETVLLSDWLFVSF